MAKVAGAQNFDGRNWHEQHIAKRTRAALEEQDRAFAERHAGDTLPELACYLRRCAKSPGLSVPFGKLQEISKKNARISFSYKL